MTTPCTGPLSLRAHIKAEFHKTDSLNSYHHLGANANAPNQIISFSQFRCKTSYIAPAGGVGRHCSAQITLSDRRATAIRQNAPSANAVGVFSILAQGGTNMGRVAVSGTLATAISRPSYAHVTIFKGNLSATIPKLSTAAPAKWCVFWITGVAARVTKLGGSRQASGPQHVGGNQFLVSIGFADPINPVAANTQGTKFTDIRIRGSSGLGTIQIVGGGPSSPAGATINYRNGQGNSFYGAIIG